MAELFLHFPQDGAGQSAKSADEPLVVDRAALIDHHFTLLTVSGDPFWERYAQEILARKPRCTGQNPCGEMCCLIEKVRLDDEHGSDFPRLTSPPRTEVRQIERSPPDPHDSSTPSAAR